MYKLEAKYPTWTFQANHPARNLPLSYDGHKPPCFVPFGRGLQAFLISTLPCAHGHLFQLHKPCCPITHSSQSHRIWHLIAFTTFQAWGVRMALPFGAKSIPSHYGTSDCEDSGFLPVYSPFLFLCWKTWRTWKQLLLCELISGYMASI